MKGIILAGGSGTRLHPVTNVVSKQLLPVYDKPMIYYSLSTLMLAGIREILIITTPRDNKSFKDLLGDGSHLGINIEFKVQEKPNGIAEAFILGKKFINTSSVALILGDNLFHGNSLTNILQETFSDKTGATIFAYSVSEPERYGIVEFDDNGKVLNIVEKPKDPKSSYAITGLYFYDNTVVERAECLTPSARGEIEITDLNNLYLKEDQLYLKIMSRGMTWLDTGKFDSLFEASGYIQTLQKRQGMMIGSPEEIAFRMGWIDSDLLIKNALKVQKSSYGQYLLNLVN